MSWSQWKIPEELIKQFKIQALHDSYLNIETIDFNEPIGYQYGNIQIITFSNQLMEHKHVWNEIEQFKRSFWAFLIEKFYTIASNIQYNMNLTIVWFPIQKEKSIVNAPHFFHPNVWNTGSYSNHTIFLCRWQEVWKVLCHEVFHWLGMASKLENQELSELWIQEQQWTSNGPLLLEEAWVEALASIWYTKWMNEYLNMKYFTKSMIKQQFQKTSELCRYFWAFNSPNPNECLLARKPFHNKSCNQWFQETNVFSYVFWKEKIYNHPKLYSFLTQPLETQWKKINQDDQYLKLSVLAYQCLRKPLPIGKNPNKNFQIRFLPELKNNGWELETMG